MSWRANPRSPREATGCCPQARLALLAAAAVALAACSGGSGAAPDAFPYVTPLSPPLAGWEDRIFEYGVTSDVQGIASRNVKVVLPPGYADAANASRRYPVLYLHDGQNGLDRDPFGHGGWQVHVTSYDLVARGLMAPALFVLVDNSASREQEYVPDAGTAPGPTAEAYLDFLERRVMPWVEARYRTLPGPAGRAIGGSSFGALISLYAGWTRPGVYGTVMAMSPSLWRANLTGDELVKLPVRVYLDSGTVDWSGGDDGCGATTALAELMVQKGWTLHADLEHAVGEGHNHSEEYWRARLRPSTAADAPGEWPGALPFLFPPPP